MGRRDPGVPPGAEVLPPLVEAKLAVPRVRHGMVDRARIRLALDAGGDAALTLVAAPAGYGKTTAVRMGRGGSESRASVGDERRFDGVQR